MISEHYTPEAVILANGEYPTHVLPLKILEEAKFVVCCDGAANEYILRGHTPDIIIGDGDSLSPENKTRFSDIIHHIADQETNDQTKAVHFLQEKGYQRIAIVGATGKREDHTLGNISLLLDYMKSGMEVRTVTDYGVFIPASGTQTFVSHTVFFGYRIYVSRRNGRAFKEIRPLTVSFGITLLLLWGITVFTAFFSRTV